MTIKKTAPQPMGPVTYGATDVKPGGRSGRSNPLTIKDQRDSTFLNQIKQWIGVAINDRLQRASIR